MLVDMKTSIATLLVVAVAFLALTTSASAKTGRQAFQKAYLCLVEHGAARVSEDRPYGGGRGLIYGKEFSWFYEPHPMVSNWHPQVKTGAATFYGHNWGSWARSQVSACVNQSLR